MMTRERRISGAGARRVEMRGDAQEVCASDEIVPDISYFLIYLCGGQWIYYRMIIESIWIFVLCCSQSFIWVFHSGGIGPPLETGVPPLPQNFFSRFARGVTGNTLNRGVRNPDKKS